MLQRCNCCADTLIAATPFYRTVVLPRHAMDVAESKEFAANLLAGDIGALERYHALGCDWNAGDESGCRAIHWAAEGGHVHVLQWLQALAITPPVAMCAVDNDGMSALHWAAGGGHAAVVTHLLHTTDLKAMQKDSLGCTPLHWAAEKGHLQAMQALMTPTVAAGELFDQCGGTPLDAALEFGGSHAAMLLVESEWAAYRATIHGTLTIAAAIFGDVNVLRWCAERGMLRLDERCEGPAHDNNTLLHLLAAKHHAAALQLVLGELDLADSFDFRNCLGAFNNTVFEAAWSPRNPNAFLGGGQLLSEGTGAADDGDAEVTDGSSDEREAGPLHAVDRALALNNSMACLVKYASPAVHLPPQWVSQPVVVRGVVAGLADGAWYRRGVALCAWVSEHPQTPSVLHLLQRLQVVSET